MKFSAFSCPDVLVVSSVQVRTESRWVRRHAGKIAKADRGAVVGDGGRIPCPAGGAGLFTERSPEASAAHGGPERMARRPRTWSFRADRCGRAGVRGRSPPRGPRLVVAGGAGAGAGFSAR